MWKEISSIIRIVTKRFLENQIVSLQVNENWLWWSGGASKSNKEKLTHFKPTKRKQKWEVFSTTHFGKERSKESSEMVNFSRYENYMINLNIKGGERDGHKLAHAREKKKSMKLGNIRYIKNEDNRVLKRSYEIKEMSKQYLRKLHGEN